MRTDVDHLPPPKQRELERVVQILFEAFDDASTLATGKRKAGRVLKIILYGSHARGGWIDEPHTAKGYQSDFDLLVIVNRKDVADRIAYWATADERLTRALSVTHSLRTPVNFIVHTLQEVNDGLAHGRYFFMDVAKDGIAIYDSDGDELHQPLPKTPKQALSLAREYFQEWYPSGAGRLDTARYVQRQGRLKEAAFDLHQAVERLYNCVLLVCTFYAPHVHNLGFLRTQAERLDRRLVYAWPRDNKHERAMFEKLKDAYVKARYSKHYNIDNEELAWLSSRVEELGQIVHAVCSDKITELKLAADANP